MPTQKKGWSAISSYYSSTSKRGDHTFCFNLEVSRKGKTVMTKNGAPSSVSWAVGDAKDKGVESFLFVTSKKCWIKKGSRDRCNNNEARMSTRGAYYRDITLKQWAAVSFNPKVNYFTNESIWVKDAKRGEEEKKSGLYKGKTLKAAACRAYSAGARKWDYRSKKTMRVGFRTGKIQGVSAPFEIELISGGVFGLTAAATTSLLSYFLF